MSEFNIDDLDEVIASADSSLVQMLALQLKKQIGISKASEQQLAAVVAENERAVKAVTVFSNVTHDITEIICDELGQEHVAEIVAAYNDLGNMPATDAYLAEVRAHARNEGINFAASRLAAAFKHGFVDKPLAEVYDVVRMILTAKEDLANDPAADGLSGEYAEKSLVEFAAQLRQGAAL